MSLDRISALIRRLKGQSFECGRNENYELAYSMAKAEKELFCEISELAEGVPAPCGRPRVDSCGRVDCKHCPVTAAEGFWGDKAKRWERAAEEAKREADGLRGRIRALEDENYELRTELPQYAERAWGHSGGKLR